MPRLLFLLTLTACRFGFEATDRDAVMSDAAADGLAGSAHVTIHVTGFGAVGAAGQWCARTCDMDVPVGTQLSIVPGDGQLVSADASVCPVACDVVRGDSVVDVTFSPAISANVVFVSSIPPPAPFGGLAGADTFCQQRATAAGLSGTFIAMLSSSTVNLRDRLAGSRGWVRLDGRTVFDLSTDLFVRQVHPISIDEFGNSHPAVIIPSSTNDDGTVQGGTCNDWTSTGQVEIRGTGFSGGKFETGNLGSCEQAQALYCAQIGKAVARTPTAWPFGRYAFLTSSAFDPSLGIGAADQLCVNQASNAGLPGSYRALLADVGTTPASRFASLAGPWRRTDGALIALGNLTAPLTTPINRTANGTAPSISRAWLGAADEQTAGTAATTCNGWTTNTAAGTGNIHRAYDAGSWVMGGSFSCTNAPLGVYCLQE